MDGPLTSSQAEAQLLDVFRRFHGGELDEFAVMRALVAYDHWLLPMLTWRMHYGHEDSPELVVIQPNSSVPQSLLLLYSSQAAAETGDQKLMDLHGQSVGVYAGGISGKDVFSRLNPAWEYVHVNLCLPHDQTISIPNAAFADCLALASK